MESYYLQASQRNSEQRALGIRSRMIPDGTLRMWGIFSTQMVFLGERHSTGPMASRVNSLATWGKTLLENWLLFVKLMSIFVNPMSPIPWEIIFLSFVFTAEGFDDRETVIDGIFLEVEHWLNRQVMKLKPA